MATQVILIVAVANDGAIGKDGKIPWRLSADMKRFKQLTQRHTVVMGRKTHESIGRPLPERFNIVMSQFNIAGSNLYFPKDKEEQFGTFYYSAKYAGLDASDPADTRQRIIEAHEKHWLRADWPDNIGATRKLFVIGGEAIYKLFAPVATGFYITHVDTAIPGADAFFPHDILRKATQRDNWHTTRETGGPRDVDDNPAYSFVNWNVWRPEPEGKEQDE